MVTYGHVANPAGKTRANPSGGSPRNLADVEAKQLRQAELVRKRLDSVLAANDKAIKLTQGPDAQWVPDKEWLDAYHKNGDLITRLARGIRLGREADKRHLEALSEDQMDALFVREIMRLAPKFTALQWETLDRIRAAQAALVEATKATRFTEGNQAAVGHR